MGFALSDIELTSTAFAEGEPVPVKHTGEGEDVSPALSWANAPDGTQSFVVFCHDPDAPLVSKGGSYGFVHWVYYNIPGSATSLSEGDGAHTAGLNNFLKEGYNGPQPPEGHGSHRYYFWIMALDKDLALPGGLTLWQLLDKVEPHVLGMNRLVGTFQR